MLSPLARVGQRNPMVALSLAAAAAFLLLGMATTSYYMFQERDRAQEALQKITGRNRELEVF